MTAPAVNNKSAFFLYGANHKHFNSVWAAPCVINPQSIPCADSAASPRPLNKLIAPGNAQQTLKLASAAFMRHNRAGLDTKDILTQRVADPSLPAGLTLLSRYQDKDRILLDHYEEDNHIATGSLVGVSNAGLGLAQLQELYLFPNEIWFFGFPLVYADYPHSYLATDAAMQAWDNPGDEYRMNFASIVTAGPSTLTYPVLQFDMAQMYERASDKNIVDQDQNLSMRVRLQTLFGTVIDGPLLNLSAYSGLPYPDRVFQEGTTTVDGDFTHNFLRTVRIPLHDLVTGTVLTPANIRGVTFRFDRKPTERIQIDNIQITK